MLFDLPLSSPEPGEEPEEPLLERKRSPSRESRRAAPEPAEPPLPRRAGPVPVPVSLPQAEDEPEASRSEFAGRGSRLAAGLADLVVHAAVVVVALFGCRGLGVRPELSSMPALGALGIFLLSFSFLYVVLPLAFWGHTPGMAWAGITSRNRNGEPLTFDQTARRWLGAILTLCTLGLAVLLSFGGRSLTDWISGSATYPMNEEDDQEPAAA
ncbi:MAG TPA: RDD family protein [Thermoanaerobaculia bacterium]